MQRIKTERMREERHKTIYTGSFQQTGSSPVPLALPRRVH